MTAIAYLYAVGFVLTLWLLPVYERITDDPRPEGHIDYAMGTLFVAFTWPAAWLVFISVDVSNWLKARFADRRAFQEWKQAGRPMPKDGPL